jgi:tRNA(Ile)-lysidine synthase
MLPQTPLTSYRLLEAEVQADPGEIPSLEQPDLDLQLIRPLLEVTRSDVESYCGFYELEPRFDRSNLDTTYFRNWLRHEVFPLLALHNPNVKSVLRRSARVIAGEYDLIRTLLDETWPQVVVEERSRASGAGREPGGFVVFDLAAWRALPTALQRSTLREAIHRLRRTLRNVNFLHVENAVLVARAGTTGDQATLPRGLVLTVGYDRITIADDGMEEPLPHWPFLDLGQEIPVAAPGNTILGSSDWVLKARLVSQVDLPAGWDSNEDPWLAFLDAKITRGRLTLRTRCPGDRFQPQGMGGRTVKLADFYTNQKVPRPARDRLPLLVLLERDAGTERIAWVCGWRVDERARVSATTEQVLVVQFSAGRSTASD